MDGCLFILSISRLLLEAEDDRDKWPGRKTVGVVGAPKRHVWAAFEWILARNLRCLRPF
jgi:hypothetical protein